MCLDCLVGECNYPRGSRSRPGQGGEVLQAQTEEKRPGFRLWSSGPNFDTELPQVITLREAIEREKAVTDNVGNLAAFFLMASHIMLSLNIMVIPEDAILYHSLPYQVNDNHNLVL